MAVAATKPRTPLRVGTRPSLLARTQAELAARRLGVPYELVVVRTSGDESPATRTAAGASAGAGAGAGAGERTATSTPNTAPANTPGAARADKGRFVKELEEALLAGLIDVAVHSAKDVPGVLPEGLVLAGTAGREDPADVLVVRSPQQRASVSAQNRGALSELPPGARVGTSSRRRAAQLLAARPDLVIVPLRGNVDTRLRRLQERELDAAVLAAAGLNRLRNSTDPAVSVNQEEPGALASVRLDPEELLPAPGQGTLVYEARADDRATLAICREANDDTSWRELLAERALVRALEATCDTPLAALARQQGSELQLAAWAGAPDGSAWVSDRATATADKPEALGELVAERMRAAGAEEVMAGTFPTDAGSRQQAASAP